jgi:GSH-dependent disulfide-bond oxidoreductase
MALKLIHGEPNGPSLTVLAAMFEKGVDADLERVDLTRGELHSGRFEHVAEVDMSIEGEGPVLVADGQAMADSVFVAIYLDEIGSGPALRPSDPYERWEMMTWCRYVIERIAPGAAYLGAREYLAPALQAMGEAEFEAMVGRMASSDLADRWRQARAGRFDQDMIDDSSTKVRQLVERLEKKLDGDWIFSTFSIADLETYAWLAGMQLLVPDACADAPKTRAWLQRVEQRPSVQKALQMATSNDPRRVWSIGPEINRWG